MTYTTPEGNIYPLFQKLLEQPHLLIAGATGSGKSVIINNLIYHALYSGPGAVELILIDPKRVELVQYRDLPHTLYYASEPQQLPQALVYAMRIVDNRYRDMQSRALRKCDKGHIYVVIDELADLMTTQKKAVTPLLQRIAQVGRAANVHIIAATQCPLREVIPTAIKVNFDARIGLRTRNAQDSRNILGVSGCEELPAYGEGYIMLPLTLERWAIPYIKDDEINEIIQHWMNQNIPQKPIKTSFFKRFLNFINS